MSRIVFALMRLAQFLPLGLLALAGSAVGAIAFWLMPERRQVTRINLARCFPLMPEADRERLARAHFRVFFRSFIEHALWWWAPRSRIERLVRVEGLEHLSALRGRPVILLAPHFVGLDAGATRLSCEGDGAGMYANHKDRRFSALLMHGRSRFGDQRLVSRQQGLRAAIAHIRNGRPFFYLPDQDYGARDALFVPFFGVPAATITALPRLARVTRAKVLPLVTCMLPGGRGYVVTIEPAWEGYPSGDLEADTRRVNSYIESRTLEMPEQYLWMHKRFKTRPPGEGPFYP